MNHKQDDPYLIDFDAQNFNETGTALSLSIAGVVVGFAADTLLLDANSVVFTTIGTTVGISLSALLAVIRTDSRKSIVARNMKRK